MEHVTVLRREAVDALHVRPDGLYVDGTLGLGGHSEWILERLGPQGRLLGIDRDRRALAFASERLARFGDRFIPVHANFDELESVLAAQGAERFDGLLLDLGVSSPQLDEAERGFSYSKDAPLDMRMDETAPLTAADIVNTWSEAELKDILRRYGEERYSGRIASRIVARRDDSPIRTTGELAELIRSAMPAAALREKQHPAKRSFQALRIAVNDELGSLERVLARAERLLAPGGRLAVISFHSLEDRIVKDFIRSHEDGCICPPDFPVCTCGFVRTLRTVGKKSLVPSEEELAENPRARSARLRVAERI